MICPPTGSPPGARGGAWSPAARMSAGARPGIVRTVEVFHRSGDRDESCWLGEGEKRRVYGRQEGGKGGGEKGWVFSAPLVCSPSGWVLELEGGSGHQTEQVLAGCMGVPDLHEKASANWGMLTRTPLTRKRA